MKKEKEPTYEESKRIVENARNFIDEALGSPWGDMPEEEVKEIALLMTRINDPNFMELFSKTLNARRKKWDEEKNEKQK